MANYILKLSCEDKSGIVASVTGFLRDIGGFIIKSAQFGDDSTRRFFLRAEFSCDKEILEIENGFNSIAAELKMEYSFKKL